MCLINKASCGTAQHEAGVARNPWEKLTKLLWVLNQKERI